MVLSAMPNTKSASSKRTPKYQFIVFDDNGGGTAATTIIGFGIINNADKESINIHSHPHLHTHTNTLY